MATETSHIWLGVFLPHAPADFFEEQYDKEDDEPLSPFSASQGQNWYDHDFVEMSIRDKPQLVDQLIGEHSYAQHYGKAVVAEAKRLGINEANVFVLGAASQFSHARSVAGTGYTLWHIGTYTYEI